MIVVLAAVVATLLGLFLRWRLKYHYPPDAFPQVLCYHKLSERFLFEGTWTTRARFLSQIDDLVQRGYRFIDEKEYREALERPSTLDSKALLLTFDDGYAELEDLVLDHLAPRQIRPLVFLVADYVGRANTWDLGLGRPRHRHLGWPAIRRLAQHGTVFGAHGARHVDLTRTHDIEHEVAGAKRIIEDGLGDHILSFSYPFGRYDHRARDAVRHAGYELAFSMYPRHPNAVVDRFALRRNGVYVIDTPRTLGRKLEPGPWYWFEEMKCRTINAVAALTPLIRRAAEDPGT